MNTPKADSPHLPRRSRDRIHMRPFCAAVAMAVSSGLSSARQTADHRQSVARPSDRAWRGMVDVLRWAGAEHTAPAAEGAMPPTSPLREAMPPTASELWEGAMPPTARFRHLGPLR